MMNGATQPSQAKELFWKLLNGSTNMTEI